MFSKSTLLLLAVSLMAAPLTAAMAQSNNPTGNMGSNNSATASPTTAGSPAPGVSTTTGNYSGSAMNSTTPGATGKTVVPGSTSSPASATSGTVEQKTGATTGGNK
jgi:hypothetical protein